MKMSGKKISFLTNSNEWSDVDGDGLGDNSDPDSDNDGVNDLLTIYVKTSGSITTTPNLKSYQIVNTSLITKKIDFETRPLSSQFKGDAIIDSDSKMVGDGSLSLTNFQLEDGEFFQWIQVFLQQVLLRFHLNTDNMGVRHIVMLMAIHALTADGMAFNFGPALNYSQYANFEEVIPSTGLTIAFDEYNNTEKVFWKGNLIASNNGGGFTTSTTININYDQNGLDFSGFGLSFSNEALSGFDPSELANWEFNFASRTGFYTNYHIVDDIEYTFEKSTSSTSLTSTGANSTYNYIFPDGSAPYFSGAVSKTFDVVASGNDSSGNAYSVTESFTLYRSLGIVI